jgi:hypothetical protein
MSQHTYEWKCDRCRGRNTETDAVCWFCGTGFVDGVEPVDDTVFVPLSARRDEDIVDAIVDWMHGDMRYVDAFSIPRVLEGLRERYGRLVDKARREWSRQNERDLRRLRQTGRL